ncbi:MAG: hypothetical protein JXR76_24285 [Deltaproteobacteria bacterium]|nr:hypothetical protein [Deltaproteobacteria bacterium]
MKKEIFDSLAKLSPEFLTGSGIPKQTPSVEIPGELAFCLNTLMTTVGQQMNLSPASVLERILDAGIEGWVSQLPDNTKRFIGLNAFGASSPHASDLDDYDDDNDPDPADAQQAAYAQMTESYGYTPLTAHNLSKSAGGKGRGDQRSNGSNGRKSTRQKKVRNTGKKQPPRKNNSRRRRYASAKPQAQAQ